MKKYFFISPPVILLINMCFLNVSSEYSQKPTQQIIKDIDGNIYETIFIGKQQWMKENLKVSKYNDGTIIPLITNLSEWSEINSPGFCWYNNDKSYFGDSYGALYNWYAVNTGKLCPEGWRVPEDDDWTYLINYLGGEFIAGGKLKETGTKHWNCSMGETTNISGFTALPGGYRCIFGAYSSLSIGSYGYWWSSTEFSQSHAWSRRMVYYNDSVERIKLYKNLGISVRCVK